MEVTDASLVAADAGADVVELSVTRLGRHGLVGDHGAGHAADIGHAFGQNLFGNLRLVDAAGDEDR